MRENRPYGSEGGGAELNRLSLPLSFHVKREEAGFRTERAQASSDRRSPPPKQIKRSEAVMGRRAERR